LYYAALYSGDFDKALQMLSSGSVALDKHNRQGWTPLHGAAASGCLEAVRHLAKSKSDLSTTALFTSETPLHLAVVRGRLDIASLLLKPGHSNPDPLTKKAPLLAPCDPNAETLGRDTPLDIAVSRRDEAIVTLLLEHGGKLQRTKTTALHEFCCEGNESWSSQCIRGGADLNGTLSIADDKAQNFPIHTPAIRGNSKVVSLLLTAKADACCNNRWKQTPLHLTTTASCVDVLFNAEADLNAIDRESRTPLHSSCFAGLEPVAGRMLTVASGVPNRQARADKADMKLDTAAHLAARGGHFNVVLQLLEHTTIFPMPRNQDGENAFDVAQNEGFKEISEAILKGKGRHELLEKEDLL